ncbi:APC family permease [Mogibacterium sp. NSJ-24]|jgi:amino acid transporter|uniref:APC family permease n=1 Tax=Lentihominibacter hominis TaxID=2763645 RepID=A0A926E7X3_9FIRM|nr:APC family permease [Lentihominibacter hominis]MBC8567191.1 APC family permease [Lentihominibacter hominis]
MDDIKRVSRPDGVAGLKKHKMKSIQIAFLLFCLVAAGAFGIEDMLPGSGPGLTVIMLMVFAVVWAHPISQIVSELSALMPSEGGIYVWVKEALGEFWGFCMGWWGTVSIYLSSATYVVLIVNYSSKFIPALNDPFVSFTVKLAIVVFFVVINLMGLKEVGAISTLLSVCILIGFAAVTVVGFANWQYNPILPVTPEGQSVIDSLGGSICIVVWMYCGYECVSNMAGEIENPEVIPKGFRIAMPMIAASYILPTIAGLVSLGRWDEWGTDGIGYGDVLTEFLGYGWGVAFLVIAILSQAAIFNSYIAAGSRGFFVMADDRLCPKFLVKVSKKRGVPVLSILLLGVFTAVMMNFDFSTLLVIVGPLALMIYVVLGIALLIIRKKYPVDSRDCWYIRGGNIKVKLYAFVPMIIAVIALLVNGTEYFLLGFVSIGSGLAAYIVFKLIYGGLYKIDSQKYPINPKTKFAKGDITRFGVFILSFGVYALAGSFFLQWYEGSWGPEYYLEMYESGLISDFAAMINVARVGGAVGTAAGTLLLLIGIKKDPAR